MALIRRSPSTRTRTPGTTGVTTAPVLSTTVSGITSSPYLAGKTPAEQSALAKRTAYLQPTAAGLAKGQFDQFGSDITFEEYVSQRTDLSSLQAISKQRGLKLFAANPAPGGAGSVTPETFAAFRQDIELEESFGMMGSGSAGNIRLASQLTGVAIEKIVAFENKYLGIRQVGPNKAAFQLGGKTFDVEGNLFGYVEGRKVSSVPDLSQEAAPIAKALKPTGGTANLTQAFGIQVGETFKTPTLNAPLPKVSTPIAPKTTSGTIQTTVVAPPQVNAGAQYRADFVKATGVDIFKPLIAPTTVKPFKDITGISQGQAPKLVYPDFLGKLTAPGELKGGKFEGLRYADLYEPSAPGSTTLKLSSAGQAFRNLQIKGTPSIGSIRFR